MCVIAVCAAALTSCGLGSNLTSNQNSLQTNVVLNKNNYKVVKTINGEATATYIFGIGGLSAKALRDNATSNMIKNAKLDGKASHCKYASICKNSYCNSFICEEDCNSTSTGY